MRNYIAKYGVYVFAGFVVVFLASLAIMAIMKLRASEEANTSQPTPAPTIATAKQPAPTTVPSDYYAQFSFSINSSPTLAPTMAAIAQITAGVCTKLTAAPTNGTAPLTVKFTATASKPSSSETVSFAFNFGDGTDQTIEKVSKVGVVTETQEINHTYTASGNFTSVVSILDENGRPSADATSCSASIAVGGLLAQNLTTTPTVKPAPTTKPSESDGKPTMQPTAQPTLVAAAEDTPIPVPKLPTSGSFGPTVISILGGAAVILLGILL